MQTEVVSCVRCLKLPELCVCEQVRPTQTKLHVLILQHPQEPDKELGSARLAHLALPNSTLRIGLSWPNIKRALGREAIPSRWAVLHLGSGVKNVPKTPTNPRGYPERLQFVAKTGSPAEKPEGDLEGIVILDGTWSQAKTLWWRNAWLLKLRRMVLSPQQRSLYRELRKEPRRECLSTIEAIAETLTALGEPPTTEAELKRLFGTLLDRQRARKAAPQPGLTRETPVAETATAGVSDSASS